LTQFLTQENYGMITVGRNLLAIHQDDPVMSRLRARLG
jgi:hypothetical protein